MQAGRQCSEYHLYPPTNLHGTFLVRSPIDKVMLCASIPGLVSTFSSHLCTWNTRCLTNEYDPSWYPWCPGYYFNWDNRFCIIKILNLTKMSDVEKCVMQGLNINDSQCQLLHDIVCARQHHGNHVPAKHYYSKNTHQSRRSFVLIENLRNSSLPRKRKDTLRYCVRLISRS